MIDDPGPLWSPARQLADEVIAESRRRGMDLAKPGTDETVRMTFRPRECSKGWAKRCAASRGRRCRCACGGAHHGALNAQLVLFVDDGPAAEITTAEYDAALADAARRP